MLLVLRPGLLAESPGLLHTLSAPAPDADIPLPTTCRLQSCGVGHNLLLAQRANTCCPASPVKPSNKKPVGQKTEAEKQGREQGTAAAPLPSTSAGGGNH